MRFKSKIAVVTGAGRGLGRQIALALASEGAVVAVNDISEAGAEKAALEIAANGGKAFPFATDVSKGQSVTSMFDRIESQIGPVDILVNNAGIGDFVSWPLITNVKWRAMIDTHLSGTFHACKAVLPSMIGRGSGSIVNISSVAGKRGDFLGNAHYTAAKSGIIGLTRSLAADVAAKGVRVNSVAPGLVRTELSNQMSAETRRETLSRIPIGRLGNASEIANAVLFLASEEASYIIGETLNVNGGSYMD